MKGEFEGRGLFTKRCKEERKEKGGTETKDRRDILKISCRVPLTRATGLTKFCSGGFFGFLGRLPLADSDGGKTNSGCPNCNLVRRGLATAIPAPSSGPFRGLSEVALPGSAPRGKSVKQERLALA